MYSIPGYVRFQISNHDMSHPDMAVRVLARLFLQELVERRLAAIEALSIMMGLKKLDNRHRLPVPFRFLFPLSIVLLHRRNQFWCWGFWGGDHGDKTFEVAFNICILDMRSKTASAFSASAIL